MGIRVEELVVGRGFLIFDFFGSELWNIFFNDGRGMIVVVIMTIKAWRNV